MIATEQHLPAIAASADWELAASCSLTGHIEGIEHYGDLSRLLAERPDIGTLCFCVPPAPRFELAAMALKAGRHVMLEKPPDVTLSACQALIDLAKSHHVALYATWHSRMAAMVVAAKKWLQDKRLRRLRVVWKEDVRRTHPGQEWILAPGGFGVFDPGINALSVVTEMLSTPIHIRKADLAFPENRQAPIKADLVFYHPDGAEVSAIFDFDHRDEAVFLLEAETDQGRAMMTDMGGHLSIDGVRQVGGSDRGMAYEYPLIYRRMTALVDTLAIDVDLSPLRHIADAYLLAHRHWVAPFYFT